MWHEILKLPHPTWSEITIAAEIYFFLHGSLWLVRAVQSEERKARRYIIQLHAKSHRKPLEICQEADCSQLSQRVTSVAGGVGRGMGSTTGSLTLAADHLDRRANHVL